MKRTLCAITCVLLAGANACLAQIDLVILPQNPSLEREEIVVEIIALNRGSSSVESPLADAGSVSATVRSEGVERQLTLRASDPASEMIAPGSFASRRYSAPVPPELEGQAELEVMWQDEPVLALVELPQAGAGRAVVVDPADSELPSDGATPAISALNRTFFERFEAHEPVYFIAGDEDPTAKFQFSFKYRLATILDAPPEGLPTTLQLGYTQRSLWDLEGDSTPFYDSSYMPELFVEKLGVLNGGDKGWLDFVGIQAGVRHESNGRDGPASRSLNVTYFRLAFNIGNPEGWHMLVAPEAYAYITGLGDNPLLEEYRYYGRVQLAFQHDDGFSLGFTAYPGKDFRHGTYQVDLHLPISIGLVDHKSYLLIQYFNGYGESLIDYNKKSETLRAGISLVR